ncbi:MAG: CoA-binding protein [Candidatus Helarchaeota archaeon]
MVRNQWDLTRFFFPESIAIVGASEKRNFGSTFFMNSLKVGYKGKVYYVNPKYEMIDGKKCFPSVLATPTVPDVVISCIRADLVPHLIKDCVKIGVKFVSIFTSGFAEIGRVDLQDELLKITRGTRTRIIGPNCMGGFCAKSRVSFFPRASFKTTGNVAFCSQSGGLATTFLRIGPTRGVYFSKGVSFGNQADLNCLDFLEYYARDPDTDVIGMYLESFGSANGLEFLQALKETTKSKPVVIWKGGQTEDGLKAAQSHTAAIRSDLQLWEEAMLQVGVIPVRNRAEFMDVLHVLSILPRERLKKMDRVAIIVAGGGAGVEITDTFSQQGFRVPTLERETQEKLKEILPDVNVSVKNPVDLGAMGILVDVFMKCIQVVSSDPQIDLVCTSYNLDRLARLQKMEGKKLGQILAKYLGELNQTLTNPFIYLGLIDRESDDTTRFAIRYRNALFSYHVPFFSSITQAALTMKLISRHAEYLKSRSS